jgi:hypothetical protein
MSTTQNPPSRPGFSTAQREEVSAARWVSIADVAALDTPAELPALVADAAQWTQGRV